MASPTEGGADEEATKGYRSVVVFGAAGQGKSSLVNVLVPDATEAAAVSSASRGVTFESKYYANHEHKFKVYDTAGLNEAEKGQPTVPPADAIGKLGDLLQELQKGDGLHLFVYVVNKGRIEQHHRDNIELFVEIIGDNKVPCICVFTKCEDQDDPALYATSEAGQSWKTALKFKDVVSGTCKTYTAEALETPRVQKLEAKFKPKREATAQRVWASVEKNAHKLDHGFKIPVIEGVGKVIGWMQRGWTAFKGFLGSKAKAAADYFKRVKASLAAKFGDKVAEKLAADLITIPKE